MRFTVQERFDVKYLKMADGCWHWIAQIAPNGYGRLQMGTKAEYAHRVSYTLHKGEIPEGMHVHHVCEVRQCVNPDHLQAITPRANLMASDTNARRNARKTHCLNGHSLEDAWVRDNGARSCRQCNRDAQARYVM